MLNTFMVVGLSIACITPTRPHVRCASDPAGDLLPWAPDPMLDIVGLCVTVTPNDVRVELSFAPTYGDPENLAEFNGMLEFDVDLNVDTGRPSDIAAYGGEPQCVMGVDYFLAYSPILTTPIDPQVILFVWSDEEQGDVPLGMYPVHVVGDTLKVTVPRASSPGAEGLPITGSFDVALIAMNLSGPTDRLPNDEIPPRFAFPGDYDADSDVDLADFGHFRDCLNGPNRPPAVGGCEHADEDGDMDVDLTDFGLFQACFNGPNRAPASQCIRD